MLFVIICLFFSAYAITSYTSTFVLGSFAIACKNQILNHCAGAYRIAGNFGEVLIWRIGGFVENRQI